MLAQLIHAKDADTGAPVSEQELRDQALTLFVTGADTSAAVLGWSWYLLSQHPEIEQRFHQELDDVLQGRIPSLADIPRLPYTQQIIHEAMRLYPPIYSLGRCSLEADEMGGYAIEKNAPLLIAIYTL